MSIPLSRIFLTNLLPSGRHNEENATYCAQIPFGQPNKKMDDKNCDTKRILKFLDFKNGWKSATNSENVAKDLRRTGVAHPLLSHRQAYRSSTTARSTVTSLKFRNFTVHTLIQPMIMLDPDSEHQRQDHHVLKVSLTFHDCAPRLLPHHSYPGRYPFSRNRSSFR